MARAGLRAQRLRARAMSDRVWLNAIFGAAIRHGSVAPHHGERPCDERYAMTASAEGDAASEAGHGPEPIRTLIVDDHALFRRGLEIVLVTEPDIEVVGQASDGAEAVQRAGESLPDVVLMDIKMPRSSGIEACRS